MVNSVHAGDLLIGARWPGASAFLATDGAFSPLTETGVKAAQKDVGISADGIVGPITMSALCSVGGEEITGRAGPDGENHNRTVYGKEWAAKIFGQLVNADSFNSPKCPKPFGTYKAL
jgi:peptidoglycan hydrolase-like protein with peptidoglycan-binding domain